MSDARLELGSFEARVEERRQALVRGRFAERLLARDDSLWGDDAARRGVARNRLGWVDSPARMRRQATDLPTFALDAGQRGIQRAVLLGMGGSSLGPEVLARVCGTREKGIPVTVLDDTSPEGVRAALAAYDPGTTLVLVASKSGGTVEVSSFERAFFARAHDRAGEKSGTGFVAITDDRTPLQAMAAEKHYARTFTNAPDIGGRYSVLSYFGLVPSTLLGIPMAELLDPAHAEREAFPNEGGVALAVGAALGELALAGRDKLTLVLPPALASLGAWIEQLVAESTGKEGRGILPVDGERLGAPESYGGDRVFVSVSLGDPESATTSALDALAAAGHPVIRWQRRSIAQLGAEFMRWELITAVAGAVIGVDPFDEPNVAEAKAATKAVLEQVRASGSFPATAPRAVDGDLELHAAPTLTVEGDDVRAWARSWVDALRPGDYAAILAFLHRTDARHAALDRVRHAWRDGARVATTIGYGPRYLHSTGQLHKGGPPTGVFLQLTVEDGDEPIPGEGHGFRTLRDAQAAGDFEVLARHGLRVARVHVRGDADAGLEKLAAAVAGAATAS